MKNITTLAILLVPTLFLSNNFLHSSHNHHSHQEERQTQRELFKENWEIVKERIQDHWDKFTDDDLKTINGKRDHLISTLQKRYNYSKDKANKEVSRWEKIYIDYLDLDDTRKIEDFSSKYGTQEYWDGNWHIIRGHIKEKWGKLTDNDLKTIDGKKDRLIGLLQQRYGYTKSQAQKELHHLNKKIADQLNTTDHHPGYLTKDNIKGNWKILKGKVKEKWGKLTDNDLNVIDGKKDQLVGNLQKHYGYSKAEAERELDQWLKSSE